MATITAAAGARQRIVVVPGGGPFADQVRRFDSTHALSPTAAHWMAVLGMDQYAFALADKTPGSRRRLVGLGVALPCPIDPRSPERVSEIVLPDWGGRHGLEAIAEAYDVPLMVDNDANLGALAERWWGAGRGVDDFAFVKIATGIGSGHVSGGNLYRGATGVAGEIGHMVVDPDGRVADIYRQIARRVAVKIAEKQQDHSAAFPKIVVKNT